MATRTALDRDRTPPAGWLFNVWTPILAGILSVILSLVVMQQ